MFVISIYYMVTRLKTSGNTGFYNPVSFPNTGGLKVSP